MLEENMMKTLSFLFDNEARNGLVFKMETVTSISNFRNKYNGIKTAVNSGFLSILIIKNARDAKTEEVS